MNLDEMILMFIDSRKRGLFGGKKCSPKTIRVYNRNLRAFLKHLSEAGVVRYEDIKRLHLSGFLDWLDKKKESGEWSEASRLQVLRTLKAFFNWVQKDEDCIDAKLNEKNMLRYLPKIGKNPRRTDIPALKDLRRFNASFDTGKPLEYRDYIASCLMMTNGMRIGELCNLEIKHILWDNKILLVDGKTGPRPVPMTDDMMAKLRGWLKRRATMRTAKDSSFVFVSRLRPQMDPDAWATHISRHRKKHNLPRISAHTFRHVFCTNYLTKGGDIDKLKNITGHRTLTMLEDYLHQSKVGGKAALDELERVNILKDVAL